MVCYCCGSDIAHLVNAGVQIVTQGHNFCGAVCSERWLRNIDEALADHSVAASRTFHPCTCSAVVSSVGPDFETVETSTDGAAYLSTLYTHIGYVKDAGKQLGVPESLLQVHDVTKLSVCELGSYVKHFQGGGDPSGFPFAWLHHIHHNPHHWQHWMFPAQFSMVGANIVLGALPMPEVFALEMVADWMGSSMAYTGGWDMSTWLSKNIPRIHLHPETATFVGKVLGDQGYESILRRFRFPSES